MHSGKFTNGQYFIGKKVAIVGGSIAAIDLACTLSRTAEVVTISPSRSICDDLGTLAGPRRNLGHPSIYGKWEILRRICV